MNMNEGKYLDYNFKIENLLLLFTVQVGDLRTMRFGSETVN
jgi:hypothetical protein